MSRISHFRFSKSKYDVIIDEERLQIEILGIKMTFYPKVSDNCSESWLITAHFKCSHL